MKFFKNLLMIILINVLLSVMAATVFSENEMEIIKQEKIDVTGDGVKETVIFSKGMINHVPTVVLKIFDRKSGKNIFLPVVIYGNVPCYPGEYRFINGKLYIPCGNSSGQKVLIDIFVYQYNQEMKMFIEDKMISLIIENDVNINWDYVYQQAKNLPGKQLFAYQTLRKIIYYAKTKQPDLLETLIGDCLSSQNFHDPLIEIYKDFQSDYYWLKISWAYEKFKKDSQTGYFIFDPSSLSYICEMFIVFDDKITGRIINFDKNGKIVCYSTSRGDREIPRFIK